jgi:hypothetical protein
MCLYGDTNEANCIIARFSDLGLRLKLYFRPDAGTTQMRTTFSDQKLGVYPSPNIICLLGIQTFRRRMAFSDPKLRISLRQIVFNLPARR